MKPDADTLMARLSAADPALDLEIDRTARNETWQHVLATPTGTRTRANRRMRQRSFAIAIAAVLLTAAGALAAGGVIPIGKPAQTAAPDTSLPALQSGEVIRGTAHLLPLSTSDTVTRPPWGIRVYRTSSAKAASRLGRLVDGKLGAIGQHNALTDDGLFHEFTAETIRIHGLHRGPLAGEVIYQNSQDRARSRNPAVWCGTLSGAPGSAFP